MLIASAPLLFKGLALAGALYLGWLGIQGLRSPILRLDGNRDAPQTPPAAAFAQGFLSNLLNPKVILPYLALLPSFVAPQLGRTGLQLAILGLTIIAINIVWQCSLVAAAGRARRWLQSELVQRAVSWGTGAILIIFALGVAWGNLAAG